MNASESNVHLPEIEAEKLGSEHFGMAKNRAAVAGNEVISFENLMVLFLLKSKTIYLYYNAVNMFKCKVEDFSWMNDSQKETITQ